MSRALSGLSKAISSSGCGALGYQEWTRQFSLTGQLAGKRNLRKFWLANKRGSKCFRQQQMQGKHDHIAPLYSAVRPTGFDYQDRHHLVPEMIPEFIVPDLTGCELKPYVSYRTADIYQSEFTARDLFDVVYRPKITKDFEENKLDGQGQPQDPSPEEVRTGEEAWIAARQTGSDIFSERTPRLWECLEQSLIDEEPGKNELQITSDMLQHPVELQPQHERWRKSLELLKEDLPQIKKN